MYKLQIFGRRFYFSSFDLSFSFNLFLVSVIDQKIHDLSNLTYKNYNLK